MLQNELTYRRKMSRISIEIHIVQFRAVCSLLIPWRFLLSKIFVYEFSQQNSLFNLKNRFKGHFSITQISGNKSVYLGEKPNSIILPLVKRLAFLLNAIQMRFFFFQPDFANQHQLICPENKTNNLDNTETLHYFNIQQASEKLFLSDEKQYAFFAGVKGFH